MKAGEIAHRIQVGVAFQKMNVAKPVLNCQAQSGERFGDILLALLGVGRDRLGANGKGAAGLQKHDPATPQESLLVVDATTGSNALVQAREFKEAIGLTGLVLTKLDGSGKGGIAVAIQQELGIPLRFVGTGEKVDDLAYFDREQFVDQLL